MRLLCPGLLWLLVAGAAEAATIIDFEGLPNFLSPGSSIAGITVSSEGGIADETTVSLITGLSFPAGTLATSGTALLGNLYGDELTITFDEPVEQLSVQTIGSLADGVFGTIKLDAFAGGMQLGSVVSDPLALGDSGAPEALLDLGGLSGITSIKLSSDLGGASSFLLDDLAFTVVPGPEPEPEMLPALPATGTLLLAGLLLGAGRFALRWRDGPRPVGR